MACLNENNKFTQKWPLSKFVRELELHLFTPRKFGKRLTQTSKKSIRIRDTNARLSVNLNLKPRRVLFGMKCASKTGRAIYK